MADYSGVGAVVSFIFACISGVLTFKNYRLNATTHAEAKADERLVGGKITHPGLLSYEHDKRVVQVTLCNKSKRKVVINRVDAYDVRGKQTNIKWSNEIDNVGNPTVIGELLVVVDTLTLYVNQNEGDRIDGVTLKIFHSFPGSPLVIKHEPWD